jgi:hypothetical protein
MFRISLLLSFLVLPLVRAQDRAAVSSRPLGPRPLLFRVTPAFLVPMPWLETEDPTLGGRVVPEPLEPDPGGVQLLFGNDNPAFGFRRPHDPGGVGYTRLFSQVQLFEDERTACTLVLQAFTPSGLEFDGLPEHRGATVVTPALSVYHALTDDGIGLQLCLNRNVGLSNPLRQPLAEEWQCGLGVHCPLANGEGDVLRCWFVSLEAQGIYRGERLLRNPTTLDVLPGLHWIPAENWRISGALAVPVDRTDAPFRSWQITASLQF